MKNNRKGYRVQLSQAEITQPNPQQSPQQYTISGVVDFSTAADLLCQLQRFFVTVATPNDKQMMIDWSQVKECNSAALALMLEMVKSARQKNLQLKFENLPAAVLTIAKAYGIENEIREFC